MADQSISQLPVAATITGNELAVVVQNGITKQAQVSQLANAISPGKLINYLYFDTGSNLIVVYTDTTTQNLGPIPGYIAATINSVGHLILTNSTGGTTDAGSVFASLTQTFTTVNNETATLPNSQRLVAGANISLTSGTNTLTIATSGSAGSLNAAGTGIIVKDTSNTVVARTLTSTAGISITNPAGLAGNPVISPASKLADIQNLATTGILAVVGGTTVVDRNIVGTNQQITVVGGDGSANPTISITPNPVLPGTGAVALPTGTTAQRPGTLAGQLRFNSTLDVFEGQNSSGAWQTIALGAGVTSVGTGTGLTGGPITSTGTISIANTGVTAATYGSATQVPVIAVNAQGQITSASNVTATANTTNALTIGTGLSGTSFNGSAPVTIAIDSTVATLTGTQTLTNKTISGASNTLTNIGNSSLTNSAITIGSTSVSLGSTITTLAGVSISGSTNTLSNIGNSSLTNSSVTLGTTNVALGATSLTLGGLTSVTVTQDPVSALQLATKQYVDTTAQGLQAKAACRLATTANITLSGNQTIDGVTTATGNRILVKNQTSSQFNGIYIAGTGTWTRATDMDVWAEVPGSFVFITAGSTQANTGWTTTAADTGTIDVTAMPWVQFSGAGTYSAGTGLTLTGTVFSITNTAVTTGSYGSATQVGTFTVNQQGQLTLAGNTTITPAVGSITGLGTGVATALGIAVGTAGSFVVNGGALGTPSSGTLTNATGLPLTTGVTGTLAVANGGTGVTTSTGSGSNVLSTSPTLVTPVLGTPTSVTLTNATGLPLSTGVTGTLGVANGGSGAATFTAGYLKASGTTAFTTVTTIPSSDITGLGTMSTQNANSVTITGGTINGTTIGATTAAAITGTTITATTYVGISGGTF